MEAVTKSKDKESVPVQSQSLEFAEQHSPTTVELIRLMNS